VRKHVQVNNIFLYHLHLTLLFF